MINKMKPKKKLKFPERYCLSGNFKICWCRDVRESAIGAKFSILFQSVLGDNYFCVDHGHWSMVIDIGGQYTKIILQILSALINLFIS